MAEVLLKNVGKVYPGGVRAVSRLDLKVAHGELLVLVGPSGCGKTTTLRMVAGLEQITSGTVSIGPHVLNRVAPKDRDVAMVFQGCALYPHMSVYQNMAFALKMRKISPAEIRKRIDQAAGILDLERLLDRRPKTLSGGEVQRVALGRAMVRKPAVFLFDEPLCNLDAALRVQMRVQIKRLHRQLGATMLYVTHDQVEAMTLGDRVAVMREGVVQQVGPPLELYNSPANTFVAGFLGTPAMNFFSGHLRREAGELVFVAQGGLRLPIPAAHKALLERHVDQPVTLGIRPEDVGSPAAEKTAAAPRIAARVEAVEPTGAEAYVHLRAGPARLVSRVDSAVSLQVGQNVAPAVLVEKCHFFDQRTGQNYRWADGRAASR